tara:strand:+ start:110 stop:496 length:387 start_codon:yes stop_codon:yes gene_type:complete
MKVVYKIDLSEHVELFALAHAVRQSTINADCAKKSMKDKDDIEALLCFKSVELLANSLFSQFWDMAHEMADGKYITNKATLNMKDGIVEFYDEKLEDCGSDEPDGKSSSLDDIMKEAGVQNADDWGRA